MRKQFLFTLMLMLCVTGIVRATSTVTIHVSEPGKLWEQMGEMGIDPETVTSLTLVDSINVKDFQTMRILMPALENIDLRGTGIRTIPEKAFDGKSSLITCYVPDEVISIGAYAFRECRQLTNIPFGNSISYIGSYAFNYCQSMTGDIVFPDSSLSIGDYAFQESGITSVTFGDGYLQMQYGAFRYCYRLTKADMSKCSLYSIQSSIFESCSSLSEVSLPEKGDNSMMGMSGYYIDSNAFHYTGITKITLPAAISQLQSYSFSSCYYLKEINVLSTTPIAASENAFSSLDKTQCIVNVPTGSSFDYRVAEEWSTFGNKIQEMGIKVEIGDNGTIYHNNSKVINNEVIFNYSQAENFVAVPKDGYEVDKVTFAKEDVVVSNNSFTVGEDVKSGVLSVTFRLKKFNLNINTTGNGVLKVGDKIYSGQKTLQVDSASVVNFTIEPLPGFVASKIEYNDLPCVAQMDGTVFVTPFAKDTATLYVEFASQESMGAMYTVNLSIGDNGSVVYQNTPMMAQTNISVKENDRPEFIITPRQHYRIARVSYGGKNVTSQVVDGVFVAEEVTASTQLEVTFEMDTEVVVDMEYAGTLNTLLSSEHLAIITHLTLKGQINESDFATMMNNMIVLSVIDLYETTMNYGGMEGYIPYMAFCLSSDTPEGKETLTEIRLPKNTRQIGQYAFAGCFSLKKVNFAELTELTGIDNHAFRKTGLETADLSNTKITSLSNYEFYENSSLKEVKFPSSLTTIDGQFQNSKITSVDLSHTKVKSIPSWAFSSCNNLEEALLPATIEMIGSYAFYNTKITSIDLSTLDKLKSINEYVFQYCENLKEVKFPSNLTSIDNGAFYYCRTLEQIILPSSITKIGNSAFYGTAITELDLSELTKLKTIPSSAFSSSSNLKKVILPIGITSVENDAFSGSPIENFNLAECTKLESIGNHAFNAIRLNGLLEIPAGVTTIGSYAFSNNSPICRVNAIVPPTLPLDGFGASMDGNGLVAVFVPEQSLAAYKKAPGWEEYSILGGELHVAVDVTQPGNLAVDIAEQGKTSPALVTHLTIKSGKLNEVDFGVLRSNMTVLLHLDMAGADAEIIPTKALLDKKTLMSVVLPNNVMTIGEEAFKGCGSLQETLVLPESLTTIGDKAFEKCTSLPEVVFPSSLTKIGASAFRSCSSLQQEITFPENLISIGGYAFEGCSRLFGTLTFPASLLSIDEASDESHWNYLGRAFANCNNITGVDFSASTKMTKLAQETFYDCNNLQSVILPANLQTIENSVFYSCPKLESVILPENLQSIQQKAFYNCSSLVNINFPATLTRIGEEAFYSCQSLKVADFSECTEFTTIERSAFDYCKKLETVNLPESVNFIGDYAFRECRVLANLTVFGKVPAQLGEYVFRRVNTDVCVLSIPTSSFKDYLTAAQWGAFVVMRKAIDVLLDEGAAMTYVNNAIVNEDAVEGEAPVTRSARNGAAQGDAVVKDGNSVYVKENETVSFFIHPEENVVINKVYYNEVDVTDQVVNNVFTTPEVADKSSLRVTLTSNGPIPVQRIEMSQEEMTLKVGESTQLTATILPRNATNKGIVWSSSNEEVATVGEDGTVNGLIAGSTVITATSEEGTISASCAVTVLSNNYYFHAEDVKAYVNGTTNLAISMYNENEVVAYQFDVHLPEGVQLGDYWGYCPLYFSERNSGHTYSARQNGNVVRYVVYSEMNYAVSGNDGVLFSLPMTITQDLGTVRVDIKNIHVTGRNAIDFTLPDMSVRLLVSDYELGDSNGDGHVSISDVINTTSYILGNWTEKFIFDAADINRDGNITVADVAGTVEIILNQPMPSSNETRGYAAQSFETITVDNGRIVPGRNNVIALQLTNAAAYSAMQSEIRLPEGMRLVGVSNFGEMGRTSDHSSAWAQVGDNDYRFVSYSTANSNFAPAQGSVIYLTVWADEDVQLGDATIEVMRTRIANDKSEEYELATVQAPVVVVPTSIEGTLGDKMNIYASGKYLYIQAAEDAQLFLISTSGVQQPLQVKQGDNQFFIENDGIYIINGQKVVIR